MSISRQKLDPVKSLCRIVDAIGSGGNGSRRCEVRRRVAPDGIRQVPFVLQPVTLPGHGAPFNRDDAVGQADGLDHDPPVTITVKLLVAVSTGLTRSNTSLLVTTVVIVLVDGPCAWLGVQAMMPLVLMLMPAGGLIRA